MALMLETALTFKMDGDPTQPSTLPYEQSGAYSAPEYDDVICILQPSTAAAYKVTQEIWDHTPHFILQYSKAGLTAEGRVDPDDLQMEGTDPQIPERPANLDIALRTSASVKDPVLGFVFGRDELKSDIVLQTGSAGNNRISGMHFRIWVNENGILMLQDTSTNGTFVDDQVVVKKGVSTKMLTHGTNIEVVTNADKKIMLIEKAGFNIKLPHRSNDARYKVNLRQYLQRVREAQNDQQPAAGMFRAPGAGGLFRAPGGATPNAPPPIPSSQDMGLLAAGTERFALAKGWNGNGKYNVISEIGKGAFATVYKIATSSEGNLFAAKRIDRSAFMKNGMVDGKFYNELNIMKAVDHPHIVVFHDFDLTSSHLFIIMEYLPGGDLAPYTMSEKFLGEGPAKSISRQLLHALNYIHTNGIVHRDIKPENILVQSKDPVVVKLSDFGLSKMIDKEDPVALLTFCGTLLYCAPEIYPDFEQMRNGLPRLRRMKRQVEARSRVAADKLTLNTSAPKPYSSAVDIWSLGTVLFHFLTSKPPFKGSAEDQGYRMLRAILHDEPDYNAMTEKGVGQDGVSCLRDMMNIDGNSRPSARKLLNHPWLKDVPDVAPIPVLDESQLLPTPGDSRLETLHEEDEWSGFGSNDSFAKAAQGLLPDPASEETGAKNVAGAGLDKLVSKESSSFWPRDEQHNLSDDASNSESRLDPDEVAAQRDYWGADEGPSIHITASIGHMGEVGPQKSFTVPSYIAAAWPSVSEANQSTTDPSNQGVLPERPAPGRLFGEVSQDLPPAESGVFGDTQQPVIHGDDKVADSKPISGAPSLFGAENRMDKLNVQASRPDLQLSRGDSTLSHKGKRHRSMAAESADESPPSSAEGRAAKKSMIQPSRESSEGIRLGLEDDYSQSVSQGIDTLRLQSSALGVLTPIPGSFSSQPLTITTRLSNFGRHHANTNVWPHPSDSRIPRWAMDIFFYSPGTAKIRGEAWHKFDGIHAVIMTRSRAGIKINGVPLACSPAEGPFKCGKLQTGDLIEIYNSGRSHLTFRCEFFLGESVRERNLNERFVVEDDSELFEAASTTLNPAKNKSPNGDAPT